MRRLKAFTLIELLVVISIIALLIGILLPALGAARRTARQMQSNTQVRGIQQACVIFSQGNNSYYPGMTSRGEIETDVEGISGFDGGTPDARYTKMLTGNFFTGEYCISPVDTKIEWTSGAIDSGQYSYAMLAIDDALGFQPEQSEWRDTINTEAIAISDRNSGKGTMEKQLKSIWVTERGEWKGSLGWNDNHVDFESKAVDFKTKYGQNQNDPEDDEGDNLFIDDDNNRGDAFMVFGAADTASE